MLVKDVQPVQYNSVAFGADMLVKDVQSLQYKTPLKAIFNSPLISLVEISKIVDVLSSIKVTAPAAPAHVVLIRPAVEVKTVLLGKIILQSLSASTFK